MNQTVFKDVRQRARVVYRVKTRSSEYLIGIHELDGRRFAIVRGAPGTDKEKTVARDSDPRVGGHSLFELPLAEWPGKMLEIATMTTSPITSVVVETDAHAVAAVGLDAMPVDQGRSPWARPVQAAPAPPASAHPGKAWSAPAPVGMPENPRIVPVPVKGTHPALAAAELASQRKPQPAGDPTQVDMPPMPAPPVAQQLVIGQQPAGHEAQLPYPQRHVAYAESAAALLRSISKRDRLFEDIAHDRELKERLRRSLDECALLLEQIRRRDRS